MRPDPKPPKRQKKSPKPLKRTKRSNNYIQIYTGEVEDLLGYLPHECMCELTGKIPFVDVHHIDADGMGGSKKIPTIYDLMGLTREAHLYFGDKKQFKEFLYETHNEYLETGKSHRERHPNCPILLKFLKTL